MGIYLVQAGKNGPVKIGCAKEMQSRFTIMQIDNHETLYLRFYVVGTVLLEKEMQRKFKPYWIRGEWFAPAPDIFAVFAEMETVAIPLDHGPGWAVEDAKNELERWEQRAAAYGPHRKVALDVIKRIASAKRILARKIERAERMPALVLATQEDGA